MRRRGYARGRGAAIVALFVIGLLVMLGGVSATASSDSVAAARGSVALYSPGGTVTITCAACEPAVQKVVQLEAISFMNRPLPRCEVLLVNSKREQFELCIGLDRIPSAFQQVRQVLIRPGVSSYCSGQA